MLITVWVVLTESEERGLGTLRHMLGLGLCAEWKFQEMRRGTLQHLEVREMGWVPAEVVTRG